MSGIVRDAETQEALPGVVIQFQRTAEGAITDMDGRFTFSTPADVQVGDSIRFSFLGYQRLAIPIRNAANLEVLLPRNQKILGEVVVTAIGIQRDKRKVGYSVTEVSGSELTESREVSVLNALNSKVAGVTVTSTSGSPGASTAIRIRGNQSINGGNDPLIIIDGIPIDNSYRGSNFTDQANRGIDINPNDIASMSVLKGGAASALYGLRAANGAIVITTKKGKAGKTEVSFNTTTTLDRVNKLPEMQDRYSQGSGGAFIEGSNSTWGALLDTLRYDGDGDYLFDSNGRIVNQSDPTATDARVNAYDNLDNFFRTGVTLNNALSVSGGNEKGSFYFSAADLRQTGIIPLTEYRRTSVRASANTAIRPNLELKFTANYINSEADRAQRGSNLSGVMLGLLRAPASFDLANGFDNAADEEAAYQFPDGSQRTYHDAFDNPYWSVNKNRNEESLNRLIGVAEFSWKPWPWMTITERAGVDTYAEQRKSYWDSRSNEFKDLGGAIFDETVNQKNLTNDLIVAMTKSWGEKWNSSLVLGHNYQAYNKTFYTVDGYDFVIDGFYDISNVASLNVEADDFVDQSRLIGAYGELSVDYNRAYYLTLTGRQDWSSTLPPGNNSFFYPSASFGWVLTELVDLGPVAYAKLRSSYAITGNDAFQNYLTSNFFVSGGSTQGQLTYGPNTTIGSLDLKPEFTNAFEIGTDLRSRNNRLRLDLTYYQTSSRDQIVVIPIANSTGYLDYVTNIGQIDNKGIEILLEADILDRKPARPDKVWWTASINFTRNRNEVVELADGLTNIALPSNGVASTQSRVIVGEQYGVLFGTRWLRNSSGQILVDDDGYPLRDAESGIIGDPNPDFTSGFRNTFGWRNWSLSFLLDIRVGGDMYNGTRAVTRTLGTHADTENRDELIVFDGVFQSTGQPNNIAVRQDQSFYRYGLIGISEDNVEEVNWLRMRDLNLTYSFSAELCKKLRLARASATFTARNLFLITNYSGIDPETSLGGASNAFGRDYFNSPNTKSYGINLSVTF